MSPFISLNFEILTLPALSYACQNYHLEVTKSASSVFRVGVEQDNRMWCNTSGWGGWSLTTQPLEIIITTSVVGATTKW